MFFPFIEKSQKGWANIQYNLKEMIRKVIYAKSKPHLDYSRRETLHSMAIAAHTIHICIYIW
jgi:hypothetical protein